MKKIIFIPAVVFTIAFTCGWTIVEKHVSYTGTATDLNSNLLHYTESYVEVMDKDKHISTTITYKNKEGVLIATKKLNFKKSQTKPDFQMDDYRNGFMEGSELGEKSIKIFYREKSGSAIISKSIDAPAPVVVDGGFNYFVKANWETLKKGDKVKFNFIVPEKQDFFAFRLTKKEEKVIAGRQAMICVLEPDNFVLRQLVDPIILYYDMTAKRLIQYEGVSNIRKPSSEDRYTVRIIYPNMGP